MKHKVLFICHGNICRSPAAEGIFTHLVNQKKLQSEFIIDSAGLIGYHEGELPDSRMRQHAFERGYKLVSRSRPITMEDFDNFDLILAMDNDNMLRLRMIAPDCTKIKMITTYCTKHPGANKVPDPYYGGAKGFEYVLDLLEDACENLLEQIKKVDSNE